MKRMASKTTEPIIADSTRPIPNRLFISDLFILLYELTVSLFLEHANFPEFLIALLKEAVDG